MFVVDGREFAYFDHPYNTTRLNERAVELPLALEYLDPILADLTLEIGAVLPHYLDWDNPHAPHHTVIDLHEQYPDVINADMLTYRPGRKFARILCISTLEHLPDEQSFWKAMDNFYSWLARGSILFLTIPFWHGAPWLPYQALFRSMTHVTRLDKIDPTLHTWEAVPLLDTPFRVYDGDSQWANTVFVMSYVR